MLDIRLALEVNTWLFLDVNLMDFPLLNMIEMFVFFWMSECVRLSQPPSPQHRCTNTYINFQTYYLSTRFYFFSARKTVMESVTGL